MNPYSTEKTRQECESFRNIERAAAYEMRQRGHKQSTKIKVK